VDIPTWDWNRHGRACGLPLASGLRNGSIAVICEIVTIDEDLCVGLGACRQHCPRGAIRIERRQVEPFDEAAVAAQAN
jgi:ferredoxin